jgi:hypothetical protein
MVISFHKIESITLMLVHAVRGFLKIQIFSRKLQVTVQDMQRSGKLAYIVSG